jgi:hypothetical protein
LVLPGVLALLVLAWVGLALVSGGGPDPHGFRQTAAKAAQGALTGVRTARLAGQAQLDGRAVETFVSPVLDNAVQAVATAQERLAGTPAPGAAEAGTRDELTRLLDDAARTVGDLVAAIDQGDDAAARGAVGALGPLGDRLDDFVQGHRP